MFLCKFSSSERCPTPCLAGFFVQIYSVILRQTHFGYHSLQLWPFISYGHNCSIYVGWINHQCDVILFVKTQSLLVKPQFLLLKPAMFTSKTIQNQRPFQEPIYWRYLHVSTIYKASLSGLCKGIYPDFPND